MVAVHMLQCGQNLQKPKGGCQVSLIGVLHLQSQEGCSILNLPRVIPCNQCPEIQIGAFLSVRSHTHTKQPTAPQALQPTSHAAFMAKKSCAEQYA